MPGLNSVMTFVLQAVDRGASSTVGRFSGKVGQLGGTAVGAAGAMALTRRQTFGFAASASIAAGQTFILASALKSTARSASDFSMKVRGVQVVLNAQTHQMAAMRKEVMRLAGDTEFKPTELMETVRLLGQAGLDTSEIMKALSVSANAATASMGGLQMKDAAELMITVLRGFSLGAHEASFALDKMITITQQTPMAMEDVRTALGFATAASAAFGQSLDDTLIAMGLLMPITRTASKAGVAWRSAINALVRGGGIGKLQALGIEVHDVNGEFRSFIDIMVDLVDKMENDFPKLKKHGKLANLLGIRGMQLYSAVLNATAAGTGELAGVTLRGVDAVNQLRNAQMRSQGLNKEVSKSLRDEHSIAVKQLSASFEELKIAIGEAALPILHAFTVSLKGLTETLSLFFTMWSGFPAKIALGVITLKAMGSTVNMVRAGLSALGLGVGGSAAGLFAGLGAKLGMTGGAVAAGAAAGAGAAIPAGMAGLGAVGSALGSAAGNTLLSMKMGALGTIIGGTGVAIGAVKAFGIGLLGAGKALLSFIGPVGWTISAIMGLLFGISRLKDLYDDLFLTEKERLAVSMGAQDQLGNLKNAFSRMVKFVQEQGGRVGPGVGLPLVPEQFMKLRDAGLQQILFFGGERIRTGEFKTVTAALEGALKPYMALQTALGLSAEELKKRRATFESVIKDVARLEDPNIVAHAYRPGEATTIVKAAQAAAARGLTANQAAFIDTFGPVLGTMLTPQSLFRRGPQPEAVGQLGIGLLEGMISSEETGKKLTKALESFPVGGVDLNVRILDDKRQVIAVDKAPLGQAREVLIQRSGDGRDPKIEVRRGAELPGVGATQILGR